MPSNHGSKFLGERSAAIFTLLIALVPQKQCENFTDMLPISSYNPVYHSVWLVCMNGDIRLVHHNNILEGRVEVCYEGVWGTVSDSGWGPIDAAVVCRQLGYSSSGSNKSENVWPVYIFFCV